MIHIHTAFNYYNLQGVGNGLKASGRPRSAMFLTSMTSACVHGPSAPARNVSDPEECYALTSRELYDTVAALGLDYVDLMILHGPSERYGHTGGCSKQVCELNQAQWRAYQDFYSQGKARAIGVSNFCESCLKCLMSHPTSHVVPAVNQVQLHVGMGPNPEGLPSYCDNQGIVVQAYSPLASGMVVNDTDCAAVGAEHNKTAAQVGLAWILQQSDNRTFVVKVAQTLTLTLQKNMP